MPKNYEIIFSPEAEEELYEYIANHFYEAYAKIREMFVNI